MNTYDPRTTLDAISHNAIAVVAIGGLSIVAMFVFFIEGARMGKRDRVYPMALWMTALWWPHDGSYLLHFSDWFGGRHSHWFMQAVLVRHHRDVCRRVDFRLADNSIRPRRALPGRSQREHTIRIVGAMSAGVVSWALLKGALADDLYLLSFMATLLWGGPSASAMLGRRPDGRGQSLLEWIGYSVMAVLYSVVSIFFFGGGFFHSWQYVGICLAACVWSFVIIVDAKRAGAPMTSWRSSPAPVGRSPGARSR